MKWSSVGNRNTNVWHQIMKEIKTMATKERVEFIKYLPHARFCDENCALTIT